MPAPLTGWVNNTATFRDASLASAAPVEVLEIITANLALAVTGCHTAVNHFSPTDGPGRSWNLL